MKNKFQFTVLSLSIILITGCNQKLLDMKDTLMGRIKGDEVVQEEIIPTQSSNKTRERTSLKVGNQNFQVEIADTPEEHRQGLMYREYLEGGTGMLFQFKNEGYPAFWMKNTYIPLDVIWISAEKKVVDIQTLMPCQTEPCPVFNPRGSAQYVLEVNAGEFQGQRGDRVEF